MRAVSDAAPIRVAIAWAWRKPLGRRTRLAPAAVSLGRAPQDVRLEEGGGPRLDSGSDGLPAGRVVLARGAGELGRAERHPPADLVLGERVRLGHALRRAAVAVDHVGRRLDRARPRHRRAVRLVP